MLRDCKQAKKETSEKGEQNFAEEGLGGEGTPGEAPGSFAIQESALHTRKGAEPHGAQLQLPCPRGPRLLRSPAVQGVPDQGPQSPWGLPRSPDARVRAHPGNTAPQPSGPAVPAHVNALTGPRGCSCRAEGPWAA